MTGTFESYAGSALKQIDDVSEDASFDIEGNAGKQIFPGQIHFFAPDSAWVITGLLPASFIDAFARGSRLTVRNDAGIEAFSFDLTGSERAAEVMKRVCGL